jgi:hypothetical protein
MFFERVESGTGSLKAVWMLAGVALLSAANMRAQAPAAAPTPTQTVTAPTTASTTKVHGTITDPDGELIPGATIQFSSPKGGSALRVQSGSDGTYSIAVPVGTYSVLVTMPGFASFSVPGLKIPAAAGITFDAKLHVGDTEVVTVNTDAIQLSVDPDNNASSTVLTGKDLEALSDDPDELSSELQALAGPSTGPNGGQIYVDGFTGGQLPPKSSIREIRINSNPFSAQYDRLGYGRIEVFTKPGTDKIHGNIQVNGDPSQFNSANPLESGYQPPYHTIFTFGNITGPLSKSASYNLGGTYRAIQDDSFTNATILVLPGTTTFCNFPNPGTSTTPPNNNGCTSYQYKAQTFFPQTRWEINPRLDLALGSKNVLTTRYQHVHNTSTNAGVGGLALPTVGYNSTSENDELQMSDSQNFSSKLINETRFEYERSRSSNTPLSNLPTVLVSGNFTSGGSGSQGLSDHQDHIEVQNYTSIALKKNFIRLGGRLRTTREAQNTQENTNGQFTYSSLVYTCTPTLTFACPTPTTGIGTSVDNSYATGSPAQFSITQVKNHDINFTIADLGLYAETDWKVKQYLTISYGIRYETQNHIADHHDFAPRVSFNYGLFTSKGAPKTVLRGGFGIFYDRFGQGNILNLLQENGVNEIVNVVSNPGINCYPTLAASAFQNGCGTSAKTQAVYQTASNLRTPYTTQFAIGADQQLGKIAKLSVNYLHAQGVHQLATQNVNYNGSTTAPGPVITTQGPIDQYFSGGVFHQDQFILNGNVQTSKRVSLFGYVSLNSAKGDTSGAGSFVTTPFHIANDYGRTGFDVKARYFISGSITLPHFIQVSPFMIGQSGNPYNITTGSDNNKDQSYNDRPYLAPGAHVDGVNVKTIGCGTFALSGSQPTGASIVPINYCTGPSLFTFNVRLTKTWGFGGSKQAADQRQRGQGGQQGGGMPGMGGGPPGGGGGGGGGSRGGGGMGYGGGGTSTGQKYNVGFGVQIQNLFNNLDPATPIGTFTSSNFGNSTQVTGQPYTGTSSLRRIALNASFTF